MKLLSPLQTQQNKEAERQRDILRAQDIEIALKKNREELAKSQADFFNTLAMNRKKWEEEEQEHRKVLKERENEIEILEKKKQQALIPVKIYEDQAKQMMKEVQWYLVEVSNKEKYNDELRENLEDKLDNVGQREVDVQEVEKRLNIRKEGIESQSLAVKTAQKELNGKMVAWINKYEIEAKELDRKRIELTLQERSLEANRESIKKTEDELRVWAKQLQDERGVLDREYQRRKISP